MTEQYRCWTCHDAGYVLDGRIPVGQPERCLVCPDCHNRANQLRQVSGYTGHSRPAGERGER